MELETGPKSGALKLAGSSDAHSPDFDSFKAVSYRYRSACSDAAGNERSAFAISDAPKRRRSCAYPKVVDMAAQDSILHAGAERSARAEVAYV